MTAADPAPAPVAPASVAPPAVGRTLPGWALRVPLGLGALGVVALLLVDGTPWGLAVVVLAVGGLGVLLPGSPAFTVLIGAVGLCLAAVGGVADGGDPLRPEVLALVPLCHALHVLAGIAAVVPPTARVQPVVLRRPAVRWLGVQGVVVALTAVLLIAPRGRTPVPVEVAAALGVLLLVALLALLGRRWSPDRPGTGDPDHG